MENKETTLLEPKKILNIQDVCLLTGLSKWRIYTLCSKGIIPYYKSGSYGRNSRSYFKRDEIEAWLTSSKIPTQQELEAKAVAYCHTH